MTYIYLYIQENLIGAMALFVAQRLITLSPQLFIVRCMFFPGCHFYDQIAKIFTI